MGHSLDIKEVDSFGIPKRYKEALSSFVNGVRELLGGEILLLVLTGSGGREEIIDGWSDLDVLIVLNQITRLSLDQIADLVSKSAIKIGTTIYSQAEFERGILDSKTVINMEFIRQRILKPIIVHKDLKVRYLTKTSRAKRDKIALPEFLHELKRALYNQDTFNVHSVAKTIDTIMKIILRITKKEMISGYDRVHEEFYKLFGDCPRVSNVSEVLKKADPQEYFNQCRDFLEYITSKSFINNL